MPTGPPVNHASPGIFCLTLLCSYATFLTSLAHRLHSGGRDHSCIALRAVPSQPQLLPFLWARPGLLHLCPTPSHTAGLGACLLTDDESVECDGSSRILSPRQGLPTSPASVSFFLSSLRDHHFHCSALSSSVLPLCWVGTGDTKGHTETLSLLGGLTMASQGGGSKKAPDPA